MSQNYQYSRILLKRSSVTGATPTINTGSTDHTDGTWIATDIYPGEMFLNMADDLMWVRTSNGIVPVTISGLTGGTSVGSGNSIFKQVSDYKVEIRSISAGTNVTITTGDTITINATTGGEVTTASSVGSGNSIFKQKTGVDLEFRSLSAGTNITITTGDTITINSTGGGGSGGSVIGGLNTYTGGSFSLTSVNISAATLSSLSVSGNTTLGHASGTSIVILNSGSSIVDMTDYSYNTIKTGVTNSTIAAGSGNTINNDLRNVFIAGHNLTGTNNDHSYFSNIVSTGTSQGNIYATNYFSGSTNIATMFEKPITAGNYLGKSGGTTLSLTGSPCDLSFAISDETTQITTGTTKLTLYSPYAFTITDVQASLTQSGTGLSTFNVKKNGTTIFSTKLTIDDSEFHTSTAATPRVISVTSVSAYDKITVDIDKIGNGCTGAKIYILGTRTL